MLNVQGDEITLSEDMWRRGVRDGATLRREFRSARARSHSAWCIRIPPTVACCASGFAGMASDNANEPSADKAAWVIDQLLESGVIADPAIVPRERVGDWFRADIFQKAKQLTTN